MTADILALLNAAAARYDVDPALVIAQANQESGGEQFDSSGKVLTSRAGAMGVMQLMPATAAGLGVDPTDTAQNIDGGVRYLAQLLREFGGNVSTALAAYNFGPGNISKGRTWPEETVAYVSSILAKMGNALTGSVDTSTPPGSASDGDGGSTPPDTTGLVAIAFVGGLVLWGIFRAIGS